MIPKSGYRFSEKIMLQKKAYPQKWVPVLQKGPAG
jgi:hypothetical protein